MTMWLITVKSAALLVLEKLSYGPVDNNSFEDQNDAMIIPWEVDQVL